MSCRAETGRSRDGVAGESPRPGTHKAPNNLRANNLRADAIANAGTYYIRAHNLRSNNLRSNDFGNKIKARKFASGPKNPPPKKGTMALLTSEMPR